MEGKLQVLVYFGSGHHKKVVMKVKIEMSTKDERENYLKPNYITKISAKGINSWTVLLVRYSGPFLKWNR